MKKPENKAGIVPALLLGAVHFQLSMMVGPQANIIFQKWFDTGVAAQGSDGVVAAINRMLSLPLPTMFFAGHPGRPGAMTIWLLITVFNSTIWAAVSYLLFLATLRLLRGDPAGQAVGSKTER